LLGRGALLITLITVVMSVQFRALSLLNSAKRESEIELLQILLLADGRWRYLGTRDDRDSLLSHAGGTRGGIFIISSALVCEKSNLLISDNRSIAVIKVDWMQTANSRLCHG
jgi:hypothetical protein